MMIYLIYLVILFIVLMIAIAIVKTFFYYLKKHSLLFYSNSYKSFKDYKYVAWKYNKILLKILRSLSPIMRKAKIKKIMIGNDGIFAVELPNKCKFNWVPGDPGSMLGMPIRGDFEPDETGLVSSLLSKFSMKTIFDVGANFGWFTVHFGLLSGKGSNIHAFEPTPDTFKELNENIALNYLEDKVILNRTCLGEDKGDTKMYVPEKIGTAFASMRPQDYKMALKEITVPVTTIDDYCLAQNIEHIDFMKIDVEGAELLVLKGAKKMLSSNNKPVILIETQISTSKEFGYTPEDVLKYLTSLGYKIFCLIDGQLKEVNNIENPKAYNFLCLSPGYHDDIKKQLFDFY